MKSQVIFSLLIETNLLSFAFAAAISNNIGRPVTNSSNGIANPHEMGVGEINPLKALDPSLAFETTMRDYLHFLCYSGISQKKIRLISRANFSCPKLSNENLISNINYPSISIGNLDRHQGTKIFKRTLTDLLMPCTFLLLMVHQV